jgi:hypothetical protein
MSSSDQRSPNISSETLTGQRDLRLDFDLPSTAGTIATSLAQCKLECGVARTFFLHDFLRGGYK